MSMKNLIFSLVAVAILFLIGFLIFSTMQPKEVQEVSLENDENIESTTEYAPEIIYEEKVSLDTKVQDKVDTLVQSSVQITPDFYRVASYPEGASLSSEVDYSIDYSKQSNTFTIALYKYPLLDTRMRASVAFLEKLQVSQEEACQMNTKVTVSSSVNVGLAGDNLGLSFCPNRVDLSNVVDDRVSNEEQ